MLKPHGVHYALVQTAKSLQSCPTLCNPIDGSPPGSPVPGVLQARTVEWVAISFSNAWKWKVKVKSLNLVRLLATPWKYSPPGSSVHGTCQARVLEWVAIALSTCFLREQHLFACVNYVMLSIISAPPHRYKIHSAPPYFLMPEIIWISYKEKCLILWWRWSIFWLAGCKQSQFNWSSALSQLVSSFTLTQVWGALLVTFPRRDEPLFDQGTMKVATHWDLPNSHSSFQRDLPSYLPLLNRESCLSVI